MENQSSDRGRWSRAAAIVAALGIASLGAVTTACAQSHAQNAPNGEWHMQLGNYSAHRYSTLDQINAQNAKDLQMAWSFSTGVQRGHEGAPLVVGNTMYIVTPFPDKLIALDLSHAGKEGAGPPVKWIYDPNPDKSAIGVACCDVVNRGPVYANGKIIYNLLDDHTVAVDAQTGKEVWKTKLGSPSTGQTITMSPLVVKNKVLVGNSGGEFGVRGWIKALNVDNGKVEWTAYSTGPDSATLMDNKDFHPYYKADRSKNLGTQTWANGQSDMWKRGGGAVWGWISYDPDLNLIYYGTSNPGTWNPDLRPGDNKWSTSIIARDPDDGHAVWAYQMTPHDEWDYDGVNENVLTTLNVDGKSRKVLVHFDRNGYAYTIDRKTGQVLVAKPFVHINWSDKFDMKTGVPSVVKSKETHMGSNTQDICPSATGGKDQQPSSFDPQTGLFYVPTHNLCMDYKPTEVKYVEGTPYVGATVKMYADSSQGDYRGEFIAWDASTGTKKWGIKERFPVWSGVLTTAGDLAFYGTMDGWFKAVNAKTGKVVWKTKLPSGVIGYPITYKGPDGRQYVAVYCGVGGWAGLPVAADMDLSDKTAGLGIVNAMDDLPQYTQNGGAVYVFTVPMTS